MTTAKPVLDLDQLESFVQNELRLSAPSGIDAAGTVIDIISKASSSDNFSTVMGLVERFVQIGSAIAEVRKFPFSCLSL